MMHEAMASREDATVQVTPSIAEKGMQTVPVQIIPLSTSTPALEDPSMPEGPQEEDRLWNVHGSKNSMALRVLQTAKLGFQQAQISETAELQDIGAEIDLFEEGVIHDVQGEVPTPGKIYRGTTEDFNGSSSEDESQMPVLTPEVSMASGSSGGTRQSTHILRMGREKMALSEEQIQSILDHQVDPSAVKESAIGYKGEPAYSHTTPYHEFWDRMKQSCVNTTSVRFSQSYRMLTQLQCNFSRIRGRLTKDPMYSHKVNRVLQVFTREEYKEKFPGAKPISTMAHSSTNLTKKLRCWFSKRYREHLENLHARSRANREYRAGRHQKPVGPLKTKMLWLTGSVEVLIDIFFDRAFHKSDSALPVPVELDDPCLTNEEFFFRHLNQPTEQESSEWRSQNPEYQQVLEQKLAEKQAPKKEKAIAQKKHWQREMYPLVREQHLQKRREEWCLKKSLGLIKTYPEYARKYYEVNKERLLRECTERRRQKRGEKAAVAVTSMCTDNSADGVKVTSRQVTELQNPLGDAQVMDNPTISSDVPVSKYQLWEWKRPLVETSEGQDSGILFRFWLCTVIVQRIHEIWWIQFNGSIGFHSKNFKIVPQFTSVHTL